MNQSKLEVVKQEMPRVNIHILAISELKWTGMGKFNSDDCYIYYCGQESLRRNAEALMVNKRVQNTVLGCSLQTCTMILVRFQGKLFNIIVIQVYVPTTDAEEAKVNRFCDVEWFALENEPRSLCHFRGCTQVLSFELLLTVTFEEQAFRLDGWIS